MTSRSSVLRYGRLAVLAGAVALAGASAACGGGEEAGPAPPPAASEPGAPPSSGAPSPGGGLTIDEAIASPFEGPLMVKGFILAEQDGPVRLCSALAESYPPQCGGSSLVVEGLDLSTVEGLTTPSEPEYAHTSWTDAEVSLLGEIEDGVLTISETSV
jgi:hypothetical protein